MRYSPLQLHGNRHTIPSRMTLVGESIVTKAARKHPDSAQWLRGWISAVNCADWKSIINVRKTFPAVDGGVKTASGVVDVFDVCGNKYRLIVKIIYKTGTIYVHEFLTHADYSKNLWKRRY